MLETALFIKKKLHLLLFLQQNKFSNVFDAEKLDQ
jgi:hypothetical protein